MTNTPGAQHVTTSSDSTQPHKKGPTPTLQSSLTKNNSHCHLICSHWHSAEHSASSSYPLTYRKTCRVLSVAMPISQMHTSNFAAHRMLKQQAATTPFADSSSAYSTTSDAQRRLKSPRIKAKGDGTSPPTPSSHIPLQGYILMFQSPVPSRTSTSTPTTPTTYSHSQQPMTKSVKSFTNMLLTSVTRPLDPFSHR